MIHMKHWSIFNISIASSKFLKGRLLQYIDGASMVNKPLIWISAPWRGFKEIGRIERR